MLNSTEIADSKPLRQFSFYGGRCWQCGLLWRNVPRVSHKWEASWGARRTTQGSFCSTFPNSPFSQLIALASC